MCVCLSMRVCNGSEEFGGWEYSSDARPSYLLYPVLCVHDNKQRHLGSSSWSRYSRGAVRSDHTKLVFARDTTTQGCHTPPLEIAEKQGEMPFSYLAEMPDVMLMINFVPYIYCYHADNYICTLTSPDIFFGSVSRSHLCVCVCPEKSKQ